MPNGDSGPTLHGRRVLIIEDEMLVAMELKSVLQKHGYNVLGPAETVERAISLIDEGQPEAAVLDLNLNGRSALPVAAVLNERGVPFVVVSGHVATQGQAPELGRAPRLAKPVNHSTLLRELTRLLAMVPRG